MCMLCYAKSLQSCPTLCDPIDGSPPGSPVPGILQARTPEWVAISFSSAWKWKVKVKSLSHVQLLGTPWTAAYQAPPPMGFSRQEYWSGVPLYVYIYIFLLFQILFHLSFLFFKLWKYNTFSGDLENIEWKQHIVLLYITIVYFSGEKLRFSVEVSISNS